MKALVLLLSLAFYGCQVQPPVPPDPIGGTCETAAANLNKLGGCGLDMAAFPAECAAATSAEAKVSARFPSGCLSVSKDCDSVRLCRPVTMQ